ncbi:S8 family serine peptidase [Jiangella alkaliphila]|uniref:Serine protease, subtilisin family n=1 Tax=Jiangella alkaliphila TaxID=419479 RepID=A0A1H2KNV7_9ACTN|nr:S8 family serine peptidase [Jiangella alkaliphila]SDU70148.1 Serine protease, subtilisin family [Jiangella alkaliphila]
MMRARLGRAGVMAMAGLAAAPLMVTSSGAAMSAPEAAPLASTAANVAEPAESPVAAADRTFTLITGDVVALTGEGENADAVVVEDVPPLHDIVTVRTQDGVFALPGVASELVARGQLDLRLFNLSLLAEAGYDDASRPTLPLIVQAAGGSAARSGSVDLPGTDDDAVVALPSIRSSAVAVDKEQSGAFFAAVTASSSPARTAGPSASALASGVERIWLDGPVRAMDDATNEAVGVPTAWDSGLTGEGQRIAVIDTGIDSTHPDFAGRIAETKSCVPDAGPEDDHGHGTHVASTALGSGAASDGQYAGVAPDAQLVVAKALAGNGGGLESWIIECMGWAAQHADVVNMSLGGLPTDGTDPMSLALDEISEATGALFVVAAGNWGDYEVYYGLANHETASTPSTADRALSVGNVLIDSRPFQLDPSSSIGPRRGDHAFKPELTAPGHQVIGAYAAQNRISGPLPENPRYTALTGTSMATPHVAGAAALLRQQHPDWSAAQLEDALVSTTQPNADPIYHRGTGTLDVARATQQQIHATGTLDLGAPLWTESPLPLHGEVTYTNSGDSPIELSLDAAYVKAPEHYIGDGEPFVPADGAVVWGDDGVTVPAHGSASVPVTVHLADLPEGSVYGELLATSSDGTVRVVTGLSWTREPESYLLETRAIDQHGAPSGSHPGPPGMGGTLLVTDLDTGATRIGGFIDGVGHLSDVTLPFSEQDPRLRAGRYAVTVALPGYEKPPYTTVYDPVSATLGSEPEVVLDEDTTLVFDAREGRPWTVDTPKPSVRQDAATTMRMQRTDADGEVLVAMSTGAAWTEDSIRTLASRTTAVTGGYRLDVVEHREVPPLTVTTIGRSPVTVRPKAATYVDDRGREIYCEGACAPFDVSRPVRILDVGARTAVEDLGDVRGRIVLALEDEPVPTSGEFGEWLVQASLDSLIDRLHDAGAAGILVENREGTQIDRFARGLPEVPVWVVSHEDAERLRSTTRSQEIFARITSTPVSPYVYELVTHVEGDNGDGRPVVVRQQDLGTVRTYFHHNAGTGPYQYRRFLGPFNAIGDRRGIPAGTVREEYVSPAPAHLTQDACSGTNICGWVASAFRTGHATEDLRYPVAVAPGELIEQHFGGGPYRLVATGVVRNSSGTMISETPYYPWFAADGQFTGGALRLQNADFYDDNIESTVRKDGVVICDDWWGNGSRDWDADSCFPLGGTGLYSGTVTATRPGAELSTELGVSWTANLTAPPESAGRERVAAPFVDPDWSLPVDVDGTLRSGAELTVRAHYTEAIRRLKESTDRTVAYEGEHGEFTVRAWVSGDDGATWQEIGSAQVPKGDSTSFELPRLRGAEYLSVRVSLADEAGNSVDQYTLRAARNG